MKKKNLIILIFLFVVSMSFHVTHLLANTADNNIIQKTKIINSNLLLSIVPKYKNFIAINKPKNIKTEIIINEYDPAQKDKIVTCNINDNLFKFYRTPTRDFTIYFKLTNDKVTIGKGIKIGMLKSQAAVILRNKLSDTVVISDLEGFMEMEMKFNNNKLTALEYTAHLD